MLGKKTVTAPIENSALAMPIAVVAASRNPNTQRPTEKKTQVWCDLWNKPRHSRETCWKIHGKPMNWKPMERKNNKLGNQSNRNIVVAITAEMASLSREQMEQFLQLLKSNPPATTPIGLLAQINSVFSITTCSSAPWILDSSASDHITSISNWFQTYVLCPGNKKVQIADGSLSPIVGKDSISISENIVLQSVLHVPKLTVKKND